MSAKTPLTLRGIEKLREELKRLKSVERPAIVKAIAEARAHGDISENAEYHAAKEKQSHLEGRILQVEDWIARAEVIARLENAVDWLLEQQDAQGRWPNQFRYTGKMHIDIDRGRGPSRWVTLRACRVLKMVAEASRAGA